MKKFSIAIDGPGGAGKSTAARLLAKELNFVYIDTGAMYRAAALFCINNSIPFEQEAVKMHLDHMDITVRYLYGEQRVFLGSDDVSEDIRTRQVSEASSVIAAFPEVREKLVELQRRLAKNADVVMDGRDIGTYVLPFADIKIYLDADVEQRARRRLAELLERGINADLEQIKKEIQERDYRDSNREFSPLRRAEGAIILDTSNMEPVQVKDYIAGIVAKSQAGVWDVL